MGSPHPYVSSRTDSARRLELSEVEELGDQVTGKARGMAVTLEGASPLTACLVELGRAVPFARVVMRPGDLNHPDAVETDDAPFDDAMQVTALASYAPTLACGGRCLSSSPVTPTRPSPGHACGCR